MQTQLLIKELSELEYYAAMLELQASSIKKNAHKAKEKLAGVSTPAARKGSSDHVTRAVAKRNIFLIKKGK